MRSRHLLWGGVGAAGAAGVLGGAWMLSLPAARAFTSSPPIGVSETQALLAALTPPKRGRPVIASIGINDATETTDYLMPYGILRRADVADVVLLATERGAVTLFPALKVQPHATVAEFDDRHPDGADYVIVPAMSRDDDPVVMAWLRSIRNRWEACHAFSHVHQPDGIRIRLGGGPLATRRCRTIGVTSRLKNSMQRHSRRRPCPSFA